MMTEAEFMAAVEAVERRRPGLSLLQTGLLVSLHQGIAADTRSFANVFGVAHALVLRAAHDLRQSERLVEETARDARTQRTRLALTAAGRRLFERTAEKFAA